MSDLTFDIDISSIDKPSYPKSWSAAQRLNASKWLHPMGHMLAGNMETCGTCVHATRHRYKYKKCRKSAITFGPGTDIRLSWPACVMWEGLSDE